MTNPAVQAVQGDLRFFLPIQAGQKVLIVGEAPALVRILAPLAEITQVTDMADLQTLPDHTFHHMIIPQLSPTMRSNLMPMVERICVAGGWLCVGVGHRHGLQRLRFWRKRPAIAQLSFKQCRTIHPHVQGVYGIHSTLAAPQYFVPLDSPAITRFFLTRLLLPASRSAQLVRNFSLILTKYKLHYVVFNDIVIIVKLI